MRKLDITNQRYGRLIVLEEVYSESKERRWSCKCDCGNLTVVNQSSLRRGTTKSCGCFMKENMSRIKKIHGLSNTKEYRAWNKMNRRCYDEKDSKYRYYGGRGIKVCDRWRESPINFINDIGLAPSPKHSLDRIDVNKDYEPCNCRWASSKTQANNKTNNRIIDLEDGAGPMTFNQQAERLGIPRDRVKMRILYGWSIKDAFTLDKKVNQHG